MFCVASGNIRVKFYLSQWSTNAHTHGMSAKKQENSYGSRNKTMNITGRICNKHLDVFWKKKKQNIRTVDY